MRRYVHHFPAIIREVRARTVSVALYIGGHCWVVAVTNVTAMAGVPCDCMAVGGETRAARRIREFDRVAMVDVKGKVLSRRRAETCSAFCSAGAWK